MADGLKKLAEDILASYEARVKTVRNIIQDTHKMLDDFKERREEMSEDLRDTLAKFEHLRKKDFNRMMTDILLTHNEREVKVRQMLNDFREEEEEVVEGLKRLLSKGESIRVKDFKKFISKLQDEQKYREKETSESVSQELEKMQNEVGNMLAEFKNEREKMSQEWQSVINASSKKREKMKALKV